MVAAVVVPVVPSKTERYRHGRVDWRNGREELLRQGACWPSYIVVERDSCGLINQIGTKDAAILARSADCR